jgi:hypothetical protein
MARLVFWAWLLAAVFCGSWTMNRALKWVRRHDPEAIWRSTVLLSLDAALVILAIFLVIFDAAHVALRQ